MGIVQSLFGGPRAPLQPKGPAPFPQPDERDRRALFWWLKRNTSYTAVKHNADLWSTFAADFEKWLRSQDNPPEEHVTTYKYILDDLLNYERGLKRLRQGDRSVWRRGSSEGWLDKVNTGLVDRRMELSGPPAEYFEQFGIPVSLVRAYFRAHEAAMACSHRATYGAMQPYQGMIFPSIAARPLLLALPFDTALPEPRWDVSFEPGKAAPKDGIYEMVNREGHIVGGMAFFIKGQKAPQDEALEFGPGAPDTRTSDFLWRLLWEDTRYKDGSVPPEEALYPLPEQSVSVAATARDPQRARCEAGQPCPREGWWFTPAKAGSRRRFEQGEVMPDFHGDWGRTVWQWDEQQESASE
jgi:hypothetical protein